MATYDKTTQHAKALAKETGESYFIFHQPEAWETRDTGWHVIDQTEYYYGVLVIDEQSVRCSVTRDDEKGDYSIEQFEPWFHIPWQEEYTEAQPVMPHIDRWRMRHDWRLGQICRPGYDVRHILAGTYLVEYLVTA